MLKALINTFIERSPLLKKGRAKYWAVKHIVVWKLGHYRSVFRRDEDIQKYFTTHKVRKLQVGCWPYLREDWINSELYGSADLVPIDLLRPLPLPDASIHYIFSEHVHEHFSLDQGNFMLRKFFRVLKKNGKVRIATPDLAFLIDLYQKKKTPVQKRYIQWSSDLFLADIDAYHETFVINNFVRAWGHQFIYDFASLKLMLERVGFVDIRRFKPGKSNDLHLKNLESHWKSTTKEFNDLETLVVEARKP